MVGATLLDAELQRRAESVLTAAEDTELDFTATHTHTANTDTLNTDRLYKNIQKSNLLTS